MINVNKVEMNLKKTNFDRNYLGAAIDIILSSIVYPSVEGIILIGILMFINPQALISIMEYELEHIVVEGMLIYSVNAMWQEMVFGTTLGFRIVGLAIRAEDGSRATKKQIIIRNLVYPLDTLFVIGSIGLNKPNGRSLGDYISKTKLVRIKDLKG